MALPLLDRAARQKHQVLAVDLGSRSTKAVFLQRQGEVLTFCRYALMDSPALDKSWSSDLLCDHLKAIAQAMELPGKRLALAVGSAHALVRHVEMPQMPEEGMRVALKYNAKNYLQQDLANHVLDCQVIYRAIPQSTQSPAKAPVGGQKQKVLVTAAKSQLIADFVEGARRAGLTADCIAPGLVGAANAFELAMPEVFAKEVVALVEIGFRSSSISILQDGVLALLREVGVGGDRLTTALSEAMGISYAEAEGIKLGMPGEVQGALEPVLSALAQELRASMDFFEHQQDRPVTQVYLSGGSARSELVVQILQNELVTQCLAWNPAATLQLALPPQQTAELEQVVPQLAVALGTAVAAC